MDGSIDSLTNIIIFGLKSLFFGNLTASVVYKVYNML